MSSGSLQPLSDPAALDRAFEALKSYGPGSGRAALLPLDQAVARAGNDSKLKQDLERRLLATLRDCASAVAREYICSKLALVGSRVAPSALAVLLADPIMSCPARNALEAIPAPEAAKVLRESLPKLRGLLLVGAINSLGARRDPSSVRALAALLKSHDQQVVAAAAAALGNIGSVKAANVLRAFQPPTPATIGPQISDALLVCAERLAADGHKSEAKSLYAVLAASNQPAHVRDAAQRGLRACET